MINFLDNKEEFIDAYKRLLSDTQQQREIESDRSHVMMGAVVGKYYDVGGIYVLGKACNGWFRYDLTIQNLFTGNDAIFDIPVQLDKIKDNYGFNKGFWRVVKDSLSYFYPDEFQQHIVYSNYCKIAYEDKNPSKSLAKAQRDSCNMILDAELQLTMPSTLLIFTGCEGASESEYDIYSQQIMDFLFARCDSKFNGDWSPYLLDRIKWDNNKNYTSEAYQVNNLTIILSEHPERKKIEPHVTAIIKLLSKYGTIS